MKKETDEERQRKKDKGGKRYRMLTRNAEGMLYQLAAAHTGIVPGGGVIVFIVENKD